MPYENFKYNPSLPLMKDLIIELRLLNEAVQMRDRIAGPFVNSYQPTDKVHHLQEVVDSADKIVLTQTKKFVQFLVDSELIETCSHRILKIKH